MDNIATELPNGWTLARLEELISASGVFSDGDWVESKDQDPSGKVRLVQLADIGEMRFLDKSRRYMNERTAEELNCTFLRKGDLLISRLGDPLGKACVYPAKDERAVTAVDVCILRPDHEDIEPKLFGYFLNGADLRRSIDTQASGTTRKRITGKKLKALLIRVPPANEQHRIVEKIETLFARLNQGEAALREVQTLLSRYRQAVLRDAFTGRLTADWRSEKADRLTHGRDLLARILQTRRATWQGRGKYKEPVVPETAGLLELPKGWVWTSIDTVGGVTKLAGFEFTKFVKYDVSGDWPVIKAENVADKTYDVSRMSFVASTKVSHLTRSGLNGGEVLMVFVGANLGRVSIAPDDQKYFLGPNVALIRLAEGICSPNYLEKYLDSDFGYHKALGLSVGAAQGSISMGRIRQIPVALPTKEEQDEIVERIRHIEFRISNMESHVKAELARSAALRQSILKDAFAGRLAPQDPNDEPAVELLARIRTARESAPANTARKKAQA